MDVASAVFIALVVFGFIHAVVRNFLRRRIRIKRLSPIAFVPAKATGGSIGFDLRTPRGICVSPFVPTVVRLDIAIECPPRCYARIASRSGLAVRHGLCVLGGVVDPDFRGNIAVILWHGGVSPLQFERGAAVAQLIFERCAVDATFVETEHDLSSTDRGAEGFGSTTTPAAIPGIKRVNGRPKRTMGTCARGIR